MSGSSGTAFWHFIDRLRLWQIGAMAAALTIVPALIYHVLSLESKYSYIGQRDNPETSILSALYFSIVTEATLGYGDISPFGWARVVASIQVLLGLVLVGIAVSKLTSLRGRKYRATCYQAIGDWIEPCSTPDGDMVTFTLIYESEDGLRYDGENFNVHGQPLGTFKGYLLDSSPNHLRFYYSNVECDDTYFSEGVVNSRFVSADEKGVWNRHQSSIRDFGKGTVIKFQGYRASNDEACIIHGDDETARRRLIRRYFKLLNTKKDEPVIS